MQCNLDFSLKINIYNIKIVLVFIVLNAFDLLFRITHILRTNKAKDLEEVMGDMAEDMGDIIIMEEIAIMEAITTLDVINFKNWEIKVPNKIIINLRTFSSIY